MRVAAYVPDLMDRSRFAAIDGVQFVTGPEELLAVEADVVVVDLSRPGVIAVLPRLGGVHTVGFGSHVDLEVLDAARRAGCDVVLARSAFFAALPGVLRTPTT
jgi:hypothetical protein